jgi:hypothetical protein
MLADTGVKDLRKRNVQQHANLSLASPLSILVKGLLPPAARRLDDAPCAQLQNDGQAPQ